MSDNSPGRTTLLSLNAMAKEPRDLTTYQDQHTILDSRGRQHNSQVHFQRVILAPCVQKALFMLGCGLKESDSCHVAILRVNIVMLFISTRAR
jgi:hypothetical protein